MFVLPSISSTSSLTKSQSGLHTQGNYRNYSKVPSLSETLAILVFLVDLWQGHRNKIRLKGTSGDWLTTPATSSRDRELRLRGSPGPLTAALRGIQLPQP